MEQLCWDFAWNARKKCEIDVREWKDGGYFRVWSSASNQNSSPVVPTSSLPYYWKLGAQSWAYPEFLERITYFSRRKHLRPYWILTQFSLTFEGPISLKNISIYFFFFSSHCQPWMLSEYTLYAMFLSAAFAPFPTPLRPHRGSFTIKERERNRRKSEKIAGGVDEINTYFGFFRGKLTF